MAVEMAEAAAPEQTIIEQRLLACDFDNTIAQTGERAPGILTVEDAYIRAVGRVFGCSALGQYQMNGGLNNRAPGEITLQLAPFLSPFESRQRTEDLIAAKLAVLSAQVGTRLPDSGFWPRPVPGFSGAWQIATRDNSQIDTAVISSGHDDFIGRCFAMYNLEKPSIMVTDDLIRETMASEEYPLLVKPSPRLMDITHTLWAQRFSNATNLAERTLYVGDDIHKDGELAAASGVSFVHIKQGAEMRSWQKVTQWLVSPENQADGQ